MAKKKTSAQKIADKVVNDGKTVNTSAEDTEKISEEPKSTAPKSMISTTDLTGDKKHKVEPNNQNARGFGYKPEK